MLLHRPANTHTLGNVVRGHAVFPFTPNILWEFGVECRTLRRPPKSRKSQGRWEDLWCLCTDWSE